MTTSGLVPTCLWHCRAELLVALDAHLGTPDDAYVNGSQVWLRDNGPGEITLEWRLHPVAGYRRPSTTTTYEVFETVVRALTTGADLPAPLDTLWDGLEVFAAYGDEVEPAPLAKAAAGAIELEPDGWGLVDHAIVGDHWEATGGRISIVSELFAQLVP